MEHTHLVDETRKKKRIRIAALCIADALIVIACQFLTLYLRFEFDLEGIKLSGFVEHILLFMPATLAMALR